MYPIFDLFLLAENCIVLRNIVRVSITSELSLAATSVVAHTFVIDTSELNVKIQATFGI